MSVVRSEVSEKVRLKTYKSSQGWKSKVRAKKKDNQRPVTSEGLRAVRGCRLLRWPFQFYSCFPQNVEHPRARSRAPTAADDTQPRPRIAASTDSFDHTFVSHLILSSLLLATVFVIFLVQNFQDRYSCRVFPTSLPRWRARRRRPTRARAHCASKKPPPRRPPGLHSVTRNISSGNFFLSSIPHGLLDRRWAEQADNQKKRNENEENDHRHLSDNESSTFHWVTSL